MGVSTRHVVMVGAAQEASKYKEELDKTTNLLCSIMKELERTREDESMFYVVPGLKAWWAQHEKTDKERIKKEALAKLTPEEKKALGL